MAEFVMPSLGADMESGVLLEWLVRPGDAVRKGDIVAVVDTQKAAIEVECFASGTVQRLLVEPGTRVAVGTPLATIATGEPVGVAPAPVPAMPVATAQPQPAPPTPTATPPGVPAPGGPSPVTSPLVRRLADRLQVNTAVLHGTGFGGRVTHADVERQAHRGGDASAPVRPKASPLARRVAAELGVGLAEVTGTGPGGAIREADVRLAATRQLAASAPPAPPPAPVGDRGEAMRAAIAALMTRSKREIPHYYLTDTVDLGPAMDWLRERNRLLPVPRRLVPAVLLLKATARAAVTVPDLNGFWTDGRFQPAGAVHLGVAVSLRGGGLVAPAIHDADRRDLTDLMAALRDLVTRARQGRLRRTEMSDPTLTVSNLGDQGVESILGVIYPPQVALVGFGRIVDRPWAVGSLLGIRPVVTMSLAADHRATDGAIGARFLAALANHLSKPEEL
ncbi:MAG TPA: 2-oxo acid dehydrogenase subunit E2 [Micromonosporaceae bacterium]